ncbi:glycerate kinase type-2 family protein [Bremerella cremea]|uniref:glycerate kinase type-2 family protein n=1 Tax=Bremerella cremea TaxID=1031537 RepID=UPI0031EC5F3E
MKRTPEQLAEDVQAIWQAGVDAVRSDQLVYDAVEVAGDTLYVGDSEFHLPAIKRIFVVGGGKAGAGMAAGLQRSLGEQVLESKHVQGILSVPADCVQELSHVQLKAGRPAGQNSPTVEGVEITRQILQFCQSMTVHDLCICLISGGGSALLPSPIDGISLSEKQDLTRFLSSNGANIEQLNTVRKQLSRFKGHGLAMQCQAGNLVSLIISDVLGDPLDVIASGPTVPNSTTAEDALNVLRSFGVDSIERFKNVMSVLELKAERHPRNDSRTTCGVANYVIGNNAVAVDAAGIEAEKRGYSHVMHCSTGMEGEAEEVGQHLIRMGMKMRSEAGPDCLITGGEPVVRLADEAERGVGGRNQQLVLAALQEAIEKQPANPLEGMAILSGGTDGEDGPTDAAGAWMDASSVEAMRQQGLDPEAFLKRNDAYHFFQPLDRLVKTGPTHTNVCDVRVVVVDRIQPQPK